MEGGHLGSPGVVSYLVQPSGAIMGSQHQQQYFPQEVYQMQAMHGMGVPVMMAPGMGGVMPMGGLVMMQPQMASGGAGGGMVTPQLMAMLADAAKGGRSSNVFFKTRICNKWRAGNCPYGDKCTYAHGEHELRYVPPELVTQLEAEQRAQEVGGGRGGDSAKPGGTASPAGGDDSAAEQRSFYKTRLCIKYMQTGFCHKGPGCTFAHGYEDLRQPTAPLPAHVTQQQMAAGGAARPGGGAAYGRVQVAASVPYFQQQQQRASPRSSQPRTPREGGGRLQVSAADRARAMCAAAGVGQAAMQPPSPAVVHAAMGAVRSGAAFWGGPYADPVADYLPPTRG